jgi:hypothetical protein
VVEWRTATAQALEAGLATPVVRDALLELWLSNAPLCTVWSDLLKAKRATLDAALDLAERIREVSASLTA